MFFQGEWQRNTGRLQDIVKEKEKQEKLYQDIVKEKEKQEKLHQDIVKEKDGQLQDIVKEKDGHLQDIVKEKDRRLQDIVKEKEKEAKLYQNLLQAKEDLIQSKDVMYLQAKGLMTSRGVFECYLQNCLFELTTINQPRRKFNASWVCEQIDAGKFPESAERCTRLLQVKNECGASSLREVYETLSNEIHGAPWSGSSINVKYTKLSKEEFCIIKAVAREVGLKVSADDETQEPDL